MQVHTAYLPSYLTPASEWAKYLLVLDYLLPVVQLRLDPTGKRPGQTRR